MKKYCTPYHLLILMAAIMPFSHELWMTMLNNFTVERANFTGREIGMLQTIREIPGFLSLLVVFLLILMREQLIAYIALLLLGVATFVVGLFPHEFGLYITTFLLSLGFHYYEVVKRSLTLQWIEQDKTAHVMGQQLSVAAFSTLCVYGIIWSARTLFNIDYTYIYMVGASITIIGVIFCIIYFPKYQEKQAQHKKLFLRSQYWLYYALTFMSGARRQIFIVFASFLMVEKFNYSVADITILYLINQCITLYFAPKVGLLIKKFGERTALIFEYVGLIIIFVSYAFVTQAEIAAFLYIIDHIFFAFAIAIETYFQKIAKRADIASTAGVSFSINHVAAVIIPASLGLVWLHNHAIVFMIGACFAVISLILAFFIPKHPSLDNSATIPFKFLSYRKN